MPMPPIRGTSKTYKGYFRPTNPSKYDGDVTEIVYRSRWEFVLMSRLDIDKSIVKWSSEETIIRYPNPLTGRTSRYFPDFKVWKTGLDGKVSVVLIEVKPFKEVSAPDLAKGKTKAGKPSARYMKECMTYAKNAAKWDAARAYCASRGWGFIIMTEYELGLAVKPNKL